VSAGSIPAQEVEVEKGKGWPGEEETLAPIKKGEEG